jgi:NAD(P)-dependent dehydrogenase (short-subunit alcohol dehydrogenase family)
MPYPFYVRVERTIHCEGHDQPLKGRTRYMSLQGKTALITGGTSGMGSATALAMAEKGASVIITGRDEARGASTVEKIRAGGHDAQFIAADFSQMSEVGRVADAAGEIDVLVNWAWAAEFGPQNVRVNAVAPGPTLTPTLETKLAMAEEFAKTIPLGRIADVHELSDVITFLVTPAAGYINGAIIPVDGGRLAI